MENYFFVLVLVAFALFGIWDFVQSRSRVRGFYQSVNFTDSGQSALAQPPESTLLHPLKTSHLFTGHYNGYKLDHCRAFPKTRGQFTLSKVKRKHNQSNWSVTRLHSEAPLPAFCILPKSLPETIFLMIDDPGIELGEDDELSNRYHVRSNHPEWIKQLFKSTIREFLLEKELISIECIDNTVIIKRVWPVDHFEKRFSAEINCAAIVAGNLTAA